MSDERSFHLDALQAPKGRVFSTTLDFLVDSSVDLLLLLLVGGLLSFHLGFQESKLMGGAPLPVSCTAVEVACLKNKCTFS